MQINVYQYDSDDRLRCMARHVTVAGILGDDHEERQRIERDLLEHGSAQYGGGSAPFCLIFRTVK